MTKHYDLFAVGESVVDLISSDITDDIGEKNLYRLFPGGQVSNLAANVSRLGKKAALATCWGTDGFGKFLERDLKSKGVDLSLVQETDKAATTLSVIARNLESPDFIIHRGTDALLEFNEAMLKTAESSKVIHSSAFALSRDPARTTIMRVIEHGAASGSSITLDPNYHPGVWPDVSDFIEILKKAFQYASVTKPSLVDCFRLFGEGQTPEQYAAIFKSWGAKNVVITMGDQGVFLSTEENECFEIQPNPIEIVDVTGAGDTFWSGMITGIVEGLPILEAALAGQAAAEFKLQTLGPIKTMPPWEKLLDISKTIKHKKCEL